METALLFARVFLAAVFGVAGVAKLADLPGSRRAVIGFGMPERVAPFFGLLLPLVELAIAIALLTTALAWYGAVAGLALLLLFVVAIGVNMALGRNPDCHCFGQLHSAPAGPATLARNVVFAVPAAFVALQGAGGAGPGVLDWLGAMGPTDRMIVVIGGIGLALIAVEGWLLLMLLRQNGRLMLRVDEMETRLDAVGERSDAFDDEDDDEDGFEGFASERPGARAHAAAGLPVGSPAPAFRLPGVHGETQTLEALLAPELPTALLFMDPHCGPCNALMPEVGRWQREHDDRLTVAVISRGSVQANRPKVDEHGLANVMLQKNREVAESFKVHGTPGAVIVRADGTVGTPAALGADAIKALVGRALGQAAPADGRANGHDHAGHAHDGHDHDHEGHAHAGHDHAGQGPVARLGDPAPAIKLPDLGGQTVDVADLRGSKVLMVFWNQGCGFCRRMLPDLQAWDASPPAGAPKLLVVSTGSPDEHKDMNLRAPVLLDQAFSVAPAFGANGTPMAVLLDEQGRVASQVATGAEEVLGLANGRMPSAKSGPAVPDPAIDRSVGEEAPDFELSDLDGKRVSLREYRGTPTLLLFWGPSCGFCQRLLPELKAWEANPPPDAPKLLVLATGTAEANRAQGFRSPVLLDDVFAVGRLYGARGTPSGMLVDAEGKIAAPLGVGAQSVLKLAGGPSAARAESA